MSMHGDKRGVIHGCDDVIAGMAGHRLQLSKWAYRADFVVYPMLIGVLGTVSLERAKAAAAARWFAEVLAGLLLWTLLEYVLHRWVLHRMPPVRRLHALHHAHPGALIGTPTWLSAALFMLVGAALALEVSMQTAGGLVVGLMSGYLVYALVHDAVHHRAARPGSWLHGAKLRHARHHRPPSTTDFGVTSGLWDRVFGTAARPTQARERRTR